MANTVLVSNDNHDLQQLAETFATDSTVQAILLKNVFTREVNLVSAQTGKKSNLITQSVVDANRGNRTLETTGLTSKEDAYIDIAVGLTEITKKFTDAYVSEHDIDSHRIQYNPRIHTPHSHNTLNRGSVGFLNTSVVFKGENLHIYGGPSPKSGDMFIVKAFDSTAQGNQRDNLVLFAHNPQKAKATSVGLSMIALKV